MTDQSSLFSLETLPDTVAATSSRASVSGPTRVASPGSRTITHGGLDLVHANRSASAEGAAGPPIDGISGRTYFGSSVPDGPLASWESRLRSRLAGIGSTESALIWRRRRIRSGEWVSVLVPSTVLTNGSASIGARWPTTTATDVQETNPDKILARRQERRERNPGTGGYALDLGDVMTLARWPSAATRTEGGGSYSDPDKAKARTESGHQVNLQDVMVANAGRWSTARASDGEKGGPSQSFSAGGEPLPAQMHAARWATATARDYRSGAASPATHDRNARPLNEQMTPPAGTEAGTPTTNGSSATTGKRGVPNPELPCWFQGLPPEYLCGGVWAVRSTRNSPPRSSKPSSKQSRHE